MAGMQKLDVAVLGATGAVGQRFVELLENHPWFRVTEVVGSSRSAGRTYAEAASWVLDGGPPASVSGLTVKPLDGELSAPLVFSALPKEAAEEREVILAKAGHVVCTNASVNRMWRTCRCSFPRSTPSTCGCSRRSVGSAAGRAARSSPTPTARSCRS